MGKLALGYCGGNCKETSAKTEFYAPFKTIAGGIQGPVYFNRVQYCLNHGCGWKLNLPVVEIPPKEALEIKSPGILSYFRRTKKRFPKIDINQHWQRWVRSCLGSFDAYLMSLDYQEAQRVGG